MKTRWRSWPRCSFRPVTRTASLPSSSTASPDSRAWVTWSMPPTQVGTKSNTSPVTDCYRQIHNYNCKLKPPCVEYEKRQLWRPPVVVSSETINLNEDSFYLWHKEGSVMSLALVPPSFIFDVFQNRHTGTLFLLVSFAHTHTHTKLLNYYSLNKISKFPVCAQCISEFLRYSNLICKCIFPLSAHCFHFHLETSLISLVNCIYPQKIKCKQVVDMMSHFEETQKLMHLPTTKSWL